MLGNDFRTFLQEVKARFPNEYVEVDKEIAPAYETTAIVTKLEMQKRTPILFFKKVKGSEFPLVVNACASRSLVAASIGVGKDELSDKYLQALNHPIKPQVARDGPVHEVVNVGEDVDVERLPQMIYYNTDIGPYLSGCIVMVKGPNKLGIYMTPGKHLSQIYEKTEQRNKPMELAIVLGNHPAWCIGALFIGPYATDERDIMGGLMGSPLALGQAKTVGLQVPGWAEIVIAGEVAPFGREEEGPYGEFTGYSAGQVRRPFINIKAITHRKGAIFQDVC